MIVTQTEQDGQILVSPRYPTGKRMECSAARAIQDVKHNVPFQIIVANFSGEKKHVFKNRVVTMAEGVLRLMMATTKTAGETLRIV